MNVDNTALVLFALMLALVLRTGLLGLPRDFLLQIEPRRYRYVVDQDRLTISELVQGSSSALGDLKPSPVSVQSGDHCFAALLPRKALATIRRGGDAELAFDAIPGRIFQARIILAGDVITQGRVQAGINRSRVRVLARLELVEDVSRYQLHAGSIAHMAIFNERRIGVALVRRLLLRVKAWLNYFA